MAFRSVFGAPGDLNSVSAVASSLPIGLALGEQRFEDDKKYVLCYNKGNSAIPKGYAATPADGSSGPYSVTISTVTNSFHHLGAVHVNNATVPTGYYFWGMKSGRAGGAVCNSAIATATVLKLGGSGLYETIAQSTVTGNVAVGVNLGGAASKTMTTGAYTGDPFISFP